MIGDKMKKEYQVLTNDERVWLDIPYEQPPEEWWDIDVHVASVELKNMIQDDSCVKDLIEDFQCSLVVETNDEYWPFANVRIEGKVL